MCYVKRKGVLKMCGCNDEKKTPCKNCSCDSEKERKAKAYDLINEIMLGSKFSLPKFLENFFFKNS